MVSSIVARDWKVIDLVKTQYLESQLCVLTVVGVLHCSGSAFIAPPNHRIIGFSSNVEAFLSVLGLSDCSLAVGLPASV
jgi:hypothetical protein